MLIALEIRPLPVLIVGAGRLSGRGRQVTGGDRWGIPQELEHVDAIQSAAEKEVIDSLNALLPRHRLHESGVQCPGQPQQSFNVPAVACTSATLRVSCGQKNLPYERVEHLLHCLSLVTPNRSVCIRFQQQRLPLQDVHVSTDVYGKQYLKDMCGGQRTCS